jgi:ABC-2 type transport system permease protein
MKFNWQRLLAVMYKEFIQMRRDRLTFAMIIAMPLLQLILFGYAINTNPRHLPTAVVSASLGSEVNAFIIGLENTKYFHITKHFTSPKEAKQALARGDVLFVVSITTDFHRKLARGLRPQILVEADGTDPIASGNALNTIPNLIASVFQFDRQGPLFDLQTPLPSVDAILQTKYNPEAITQYAIVPGLLGVILTMTMIMITSLAMTRERERGTMEVLLATPLRPLEVMIGKITPYIIVGYLQVTLILITSLWLFHVPIAGSVLLLYLCCLPFMAANLAVGLTFSSIAQNQLQAVQMAFFFFLPSVLLSGFMFPFDGMPYWAQCVGNILPLTHFLRIVRGIMLKGNTFLDIVPQLWPMALFFLGMIILGMKRFHRTLD